VDRGVHELSRAQRARGCRTAALYGGFYAQDSWRLTSRLTFDYGLRVEHHGAIYESRGEHSGFDPNLWTAANVPILYEPACRTGVPGNLSCSSVDHAAIDPRFPDVFLNRALIGSVVPGVGSGATRPSHRPCLTANRSCILDASQES
jgi:hypothetical protein